MGFALQEHPWISSEKHRFGRPGTEYDFAARNAQKAFDQYNERERAAKDLAKDVNRRVSALAVSSGQRKGLTGSRSRDSILLVARTTSSVLGRVPEALPLPWAGAQHV